MNRSKVEQIEEAVAKLEAIELLGVYFCPLCKNVMQPCREYEEGSLIFQCIICGSLEVDFAKKTVEECVLSTEEIVSCNAITT